LQHEVAAVERALESLLRATREAWSTREPDAALANATPYPQAFGQVVLAWLWLDVARAAVAASTATDTSERAAFLRGKRQAARYFVDYELPKFDGWLSVVAARNTTCRDMQDAWFAS